jgi:hypothetical protein
VTRRVQVSVSYWVQVAVLGAIAALFYIPYGTWQLLSLELRGPGRGAAAQLGFAVVEKQPYLVKAFLREGVPIDARCYLDKTALELACDTGELDTSRYLVSKGASLDKAPECRRFGEFAVLMKPVAVPTQGQSGLPEVPGTTVKVTSP